LDMQAIHQFLTTTATELGIKILAAIAFWFIGRWLIHRVIDVMRAALNRNNIDPTLIKYLGSKRLLLPHILDAVENHVTVGEISHRLRRVWGEYREAVTV